MVDSLSTGLLLGASAVTGAGLLSSHVYRLRSLMSRQAGLRGRLDAIEDLMYTHDQAGEPAPDPTRASPFVMSGPNDAIVSLDRLLALGKPVMLVFTDPTTGTGASLLAQIGAWQQVNDFPLTVAALGPNSADSRTPIVPPTGIGHILYQEDSDISRSYGITLTPAVVLMRSNGALAGPPTVGARGIEALLESVAKASLEARALREASVAANTPAIGQPAPMVILSDLDDVEQSVVLPERPQILLFWSPLCGYCNQLAPDLHAWESAPPAELPSLTLVTRGSVEQNRSEHFGFRTLLDDDLSASNAFGAVATPSAIVIDSNGNVVSPMARGIREVRELLRMSPATVTTESAESQTPTRPSVSLRIAS